MLKNSSDKLKTTSKSLRNTTGKVTQVLGQKTEDFRKHSTQETKVDKCK